MKKEFIISLLLLMIVSVINSYYGRYYLDSYSNYFKKRANYHQYKSKFKKQSYQTTCIRSSYKGNNYSNIEIDLKSKKIKLPKLGYVSIRGYRNLEYIHGRIINATLEKKQPINIMF